MTSITGASRHCDGLFQHDAVAGLLGHRPLQFVSEKLVSVIIPSFKMGGGEAAVACCW